MFHWMETHGIELWFIYYFLISIIGTLPPLPANAGYMAQWGFAAAHAFCGNLKQMIAAVGAPAAPKEQP